MNKKSRERGDNWTTEEKDIFMEIIKESTAIIEDKRSDTNTNNRKVAEWQKIQNKLQELTGKCQDVAQIKGYWRRIKMAAKKNVADHRRALRGTGGGPRPPSPTEEVQIIMSVCPTDFIEDKNEFDSDGIFEKGDAIQQHTTGKEINLVTSNELLILEDGPSTLIDVEEVEDVEVGEASIIIEDTVIDDINEPVDKIITKQTALRTKIATKNKNVNVNSKMHKAGASHKNIILNSNVDFKEKTFKLMEEEYALKLKFQKQDLAHQELRHKLEIDILLQEKEKNAIEIQILKKKNNLI